MGNEENQYSELMEVQFTSKNAEDILRLYEMITREKISAEEIKRHFEFIHFTKKLDQILLVNGIFLEKPTILIETCGAIEELFIIFRIKDNRSVPMYIMPLFQYCNDLADQFQEMSVFAGIEPSKIEEFQFFNRRELNKETLEWIQNDEKPV